MRSKGVEDGVLFQGPFHPRRFLEWILPFPWGNPLGGEPYSPPFALDSGHSTPWILSYYLGLPFMAGGILLFSLRDAVKNRFVGMCFFFALIFTVIALGKAVPAVPRILSLIPGFNLFRTPEKYMFFAHLAAGLGFALLWQSPKKIRSMFVKRRRWGKFAFWGFFSAQLATLLFIHLTTQFSFPRQWLNATPRLMDHLKDRGQDGRFYAYRDALGPRMPHLHYAKKINAEWNLLKENVGLRFGVRYLGGYSSAIPQSTVAAWEQIRKNPFPHFDLYGVRYLLMNPDAITGQDKTLSLLATGTAPDFALIENRQAFPRYFVIDSPETPRIEAGSIAGEMVTQARLSVLKDLSALREFAIDVPPSASRWLLISENFDRHWVARDAQGRVPLVNIYPGIFAVRLQPGQNQIRLKYSFPGQLWIIAIAAIAQGSCLIFLAAKGLQKIRPTFTAIISRSHAAPAANGEFLT